MIQTNREQLIEIFTQWNLEYYENGVLDPLESYKDAELAIKQADALIEKLGGEE